MNNDQAKPTVRTLPNSLAAARQIEEEIVREAQQGGYSPEAVFAIKLSLEEALTNAVRHVSNQIRHSTYTAA